MRKVSVILALLAICLPSVSEAGCTPDQHGSSVCGEGKDAIRIFAATISPSKKLAFGWRTPTGLPAGRDLPSVDIENVLVRLEDGAVLTKLGGEFWETGEMIANRYDQIAAWAPDSRAVVEVANSRWDSDSFAYYAIDGDNVSKIDLRAMVEPALKARLPASRREGLSFRVREEKELPVRLDVRGRITCTVMLYVPKQDPIQNFAVSVEIGRKAGKPVARIASIRRVKVDPRL